MLCYTDKEALFITHRVQQNRKALSGEEGRVEERRI
jgi:hypothetical protein